MQWYLKCISSMTDQKIVHDYICLNFFQKLTFNSGSMIQRVFTLKETNALFRKKEKT